MIFSHGLAGSRNAYSHLVGSIASHGIIVIAPEHRDGSTPISYIRDVPTAGTGEKVFSKGGRRTIEFKKLSHTPSPEVEEGRNEQLKTRLWELGLVHDSLLKVDLGTDLSNLNTSSVAMTMFKGQMDVHIPGKIIFSGHSFGGATVAQFVKSVFYSPEASQAPKTYKPLFSPSIKSSIVRQITPATPLVLLDLWCLPLRAKTTRWLWDKPFPCYAPSGPGGASLLAVESQAFFKWRVHLKATKRLLSNEPSSTTSSETPVSEPNIYYATSSAHLSQSDFGILFPWVVKKFLAVNEPERIMRLNVRAILQLLRNQEIEVSATSPADMELEGKTEDVDNDLLIFSKNEEIRGWNWLSTNVDDMSDVDYEPNERASTDSSISDLIKDPENVVIKNDVMIQAPKTTERL